MRSKFLVAAFALAVCVPSLALAAYNDVSLTTDAVISVGGYMLDVTGSTAAVQSITVNASNFSVTLASGSSLTTTSPTLQQLSSDVTSDVGNNTCTGSASSIALAYSGAGTITNVITPSATVCATASSSGGGGGGGNGPIAGGGSVPITTNSIIPAAATATSTATTSAAGNTEFFIAHLQAQVRTLLAQIAALGGGAPTSGSTGMSFSRNLTVGSAGADVKALQQFLNAHGFMVAASGPGSPGDETTMFGNKTKAALARWQASVGISPAVGYFGPKTRAYITAPTSSTTQTAGDVEMQTATTTNR